MWRKIDVSFVDTDILLTLILIAGCWGDGVVIPGKL